MNWDTIEIKDYKKLWNNISVGNFILMTQTSFTVFCYYSSVIGLSITKSMPSVNIDTGKCERHVVTHITKMTDLNKYIN